MSELLKSISDKYHIKTAEKNRGYSQAEIKEAKRQVYRTVKQHIKDHWKQFAKSADSETRSKCRQAYRKVLAEIKSPDHNYRCLPMLEMPENCIRIRYLDPSQINFSLSSTFTILCAFENFIYLDIDLKTDLDLETNLGETTNQIPRTFLILEEIYSVSEMLQKA